MTLPQATAFEINPRDLMPRSDIAAIRKRLRSPQASLPDRSEIEEAAELIQATKPLPTPRYRLPPPTRRESSVVLTPNWKRMETHFDAHVVDMRVAMGEISLSPVSFLRRRCGALGMNFDEIVGNGRTRRLVAARDALILELKIEYPSLSLPQLGRIFGGRDHTTILHSLRKQGIDHGAIRGATAARGDEIEGLWLAGQTQHEIAITLGLTQSAVSRFIKKQGWTR